MKKKLTKTGARVGKSTTYFERVPVPHPAAVAAESDLVKLVRELEALRKQRDEILAESASAQSEIERLYQVIAARAREGRLVHTKIGNVEELLTRQVSGCNQVSPCPFG